MEFDHGVLFRPTMALACSWLFRWWFFSFSGSSHGMVEGIRSPPHVSCGHPVDGSMISRPISFGWCRQYHSLFAVCWLFPGIRLMPSSGGTRVIDNTGQEGSLMPLFRLFGGEGSDGLMALIHRRLSIVDKTIHHVHVVAFRFPCSGEPLRNASPHYSHAGRHRYVSVWGSYGSIPFELGLIN
jgi:hypothetical protein